MELCFQMVAPSRWPWAGVMSCVHKISVQGQDAKLVSRLLWETEKAVINSAQEGPEKSGIGPFPGLLALYYSGWPSSACAPSSHALPCLLDIVQITGTLESPSCKSPSCFQDSRPGPWACFPKNRPCQQCDPIGLRGSLDELAYVGLGIHIYA